MKHLTTLILGGAICMVSSLALAADGISVSDAWARASIGKARAGIAYVTVENTGTTNDRLISAAANVARKVLLHTHIMKDDVMMMRHVKAIDIPAGSKVALKPGGYHVMLIGLNGPLKLGESFPLSLTFDKAGTIKTIVSIQKTAAMKIKK